MTVQYYRRDLPDQGNERFCPVWSFRARSLSLMRSLDEARRTIVPTRDPQCRHERDLTVERADERFPDRQDRLVDGAVPPRVRHAVARFEHSLRPDRAVVDDVPTEVRHGLAELARRLVGRHEDWTEHEREGEREAERNMIRISHDGV